MFRLHEQIRSGQTLIRYMFARLTFALFGYEGFTHEKICSGKPLMPRYMFARLTFALVRFVSHVSQCNRAHAYPCFIAARPTVRLEPHSLEPDSLEPNSIEPKSLEPDSLEPHGLETHACIPTPFPPHSHTMGIAPSSPHSHPIFPNIPKVKLVDLIVGAPQTMSATSRSHVATAVAT